MSDTPDRARPDRSLEVFSRAVVAPAAEREAIIRGQCAGDPDLEAEVRSLLRYHTREGAFLDGPAVVDAGLVSASPMDAESAPPPAAGARIGRYRLLETIGAGGMGVVYAAEQDSPRRMVALKVIRPGVLARSAFKRFALEADALGLLQHPGIAQIFDAGTDEREGVEQPFIAMELVKGAPITAYAERRKLSTAARLELFARVCDAVQHAHERGVIHRDLKPANILVDEAGNPKILDFGIARITAGDEFRATTMRTDAGQLIGTLQYMAPEQVTSSGPGIDARADVYALGVTLYELLTGRPPLDLSNTPMPAAITRIIEQDPAPMSAVSRTFRGDIETMVGRALEKDRSRRYASASELAADLRRFLSNQPILARRPSTWYQLKKFTRRNRALVSSVLAVFVVLVAAVVVISLALLRTLDAERVAHRRGRDAELAKESAISALADAQRQRDAAERARADADAQRGIALREAARAREVLTFVSGILRGIDPASAESMDTRLLRLLLEDAAARAGELDSEPEVQAEIQSVIGQAYLSVGLHEQAEAALTEAVRLTTAEDGSVGAGAIEPLLYLGRLRVNQTRFDEGEALLSRAGAAAERSGTDEQRWLVAGDLAVLRMEQGRFDEAIASLERLLELQTNGLGATHIDTLRTLNNLGVAHQKKLEFARAAEIHERAIALKRDALGEEHPETLQSMANLATVLGSLKRPAEAAEILERIVRIRRSRGGVEYPGTLVALNNLAVLYQDMGRLDDARAVLEEVLAARQSLHGPDHGDTLATINNLASIYRDMGELDRAGAMYESILERLSRTYGPGHPYVLGTINNLAHVHRRAGRHAEAERRFAEAAAGAREHLGPDHLYTGAFTASHGGELAALGRREEAERELREGYEIIVKAVGAEHDVAKNAATMLADLYQEWEKPDLEAEWRAKGK